MLTFAYTILYVQDVIKTIEFYEKAFGFKRTFVADTAEFGQLDTGGTSLSFATIDLISGEIPGGFLVSDIKKQPLGMEVAFATEDVEQAYNAALDAGALEVTRPTVKPWGQTVGYVRDINGFLIEICTPITG
jgi:lactoylglutathione lyase